MALSLLLLAALAAAQELTDLPTLTRALNTLAPTYTPTVTGPKTTVTVPIMGMELLDGQDPVMSWYASIVDVDRDINATTFAADYGYHPSRTDLSHITFTYGPSGYNTTNEDQDDLASYACEIEEEQNRMVCLREKDGEVKQYVREGLKDMYTNVTVTAGVSLLESTAAPSADDGDDASDNGNENGSGKGDGGDDEGAASAGVAVNLVVAGLGVVAALGMV